MIEKFRESLNNKCHASEVNGFLIALSGGCDSVALLHMLKHTGVRMVAAHCNFHLRDEESDEDEAYVRHLCEQLEVEIEVIHFQTKEVARSQGVSIEMAARDLRYNWFNQLLEKYGLDVIATGHHLDDSIETFFLNLIRGTGIKGLSGIKPINNRIIRPLLVFNRSELESYCKKNNLNYRTDSTNADNIYNRNKIRNEIIPVIRDLNPSFSNTMVENMSHLQEVSDLLAARLEEVKKEIVVMQEDKMLISIRHLRELPDLKLMLFELLYPYGFNKDSVASILKAIHDTISGKQFFSSSHRIVIDRFNLIMVPINSKDRNEGYIEALDSRIDSPVVLTVDQFLKPDDFKILPNSDIALLDADNIEFPLTIRKWKSGDIFRPLGMKHFKKLSDFLIDQKLSLIDKEEVYLLTSSEEVVWVIGLRVDDRFKITSKTKRIMKICMAK